MKLGAGFLIICPSTKKILLGLRNDPTPVWSVFGGGVEKFETPIQCAKRELIEEAGLIEGKDYSIVSNRPINIGRYINFIYRTFLCTTTEELIPELNYEHIDYKWVSMDQIPDNRHFGLVQLMSDEKSLRKIHSHLESNGE